MSDSATSLLTPLKSYLDLCEEPPARLKEFLQNWLLFRDLIYSIYSSFAIVDPIAQVFVDENVQGIDLAECEGGVGAAFSLAGLQLLIDLDCGDDPILAMAHKAPTTLASAKANSLGFLFIAAHEVFHSWRRHDNVVKALSGEMSLNMARQLTEFDADLMAVVALYRFVSRQNPEISEGDARAIVWSCIHRPFRLIVKSADLNDQHPSWPTRMLAIHRKLASAGSPIGSINKDYLEQVIRSFSDTELMFRDEGLAVESVDDLVETLTRQDFEDRTVELERLYEKYRSVFDEACGLTKFRQASTPFLHLENREIVMRLYHANKPDS